MVEEESSGKSGYKMASRQMSETARAEGEAGSSFNYGF